jgi:beta-lactamase class C
MNINSLRSTLLWAVLLATGCGNQVESHVLSKPSRISTDVIAQVEAAVEPAREALEVPGLAIALVENGHVVYAKGFGARSRETGHPVTTGTVFRVGSTTKSMTSMLLATFADENRLEWDQPAVHYLPQLQLPNPELTQSVTVRALMGMATGIGSGSPFWWEYHTAADLLEILPRLPLLEGGPGTFHYNNEVYANAGYVGVATTDSKAPLLEGYKNFMEQRIFQSIGMQPAAVTDDPSSVSSDFAESYGLAYAPSLSFNSKLDFFPIGSMAPAGAVVTHVIGMARYAITQLQGGVTPDGKRIVSEKNLRETWQVQTPLGEGMGYAMGWLLEPYEDIPVQWHNGEIDNQKSLIFLVPQDNIGFVVLSNGFNGDVLYNYLTQTFMHAVYGTEPGDLMALVKDFETVRVAAGQVAGKLQSKLDVEAIRPFLGSYDHHISLVMDQDDSLWLRAPHYDCRLLDARDFTQQSDTYMMAAGCDDVGTLLKFARDKQGMFLQVLDSAKPDSLPALSVAKKG